MTPASSPEQPIGLAVKQDPQPQPGNIVCKICGAATFEAGKKFGTFRKQFFHFRRCAECHYTFVSNPWTDFPAIYSDDYYHGKGPDPLSDYYAELSNYERTIRRYEWRGIFSAVASLVALDRGTKWLDFGCGSGGLARYACSRGIGAIGCEDGSIASQARSKGLTVLRSAELSGYGGSFDVVTAIEVVEHLTEPMETLRQIRRLLKPGGLFFYTTGNAKPYRKRLLEWSYCVPEIHVGFFEPATMRIALANAGFRPEFGQYLPGFEEMMRYRILKNIGCKQQSAWERALPWTIISRVVQILVQALAHPIGWADGPCTQ